MAYEEKLLQLVTVIGAIVLIGISCYVYTKVEESDKQSRPVFIDVPYMRRINKVPVFLHTNFMPFSRSSYSFK